MPAKADLSVNLWFLITVIGLYTTTCSETPLMNCMEIVKSYKHLGLIMSPFGNFNLARQELKKVALKALYNLRKEMGNHFRENIKLTMKLFDALISLVLSYTGKVWGIDCNGQLDKDPAELVQNKFLKWLLRVNKYCNNNENWSPMYIGTLSSS